MQILLEDLSQCEEVHKHTWLRLSFNFIPLSSLLSSFKLLASLQLCSTEHNFLQEKFKVTHSLGL